MATKKPEKKKHTIVTVSGGFDPIHIGHIRLLQEAAKLGDELIVINNNDNWLMKKKGFVFMPQKERGEVLAGIKGVSKVIFSFHKKNPTDMGVGAELLKIKPDIIAQGGDRKSEKDLPESEIAAYKALNSKIFFNIGKGGKIQSSSVMAAKLIEHMIHSKCTCRSGKLYIDCGLKQTKEHKLLLKKLLTNK